MRLVIEFLRDVGKHFPVNMMLNRETVRRRLETDGMSYTEFSYLLLQSQDYLHLYRNDAGAGFTDVTLSSGLGQNKVWSSAQLVA